MNGPLILAGLKMWKHLYCIFNGSKNGSKSRGSLYRLHYVNLYFGINKICLMAPLLIETVVRCVFSASARCVFKQIYNVTRFDVL